MDGIKEVTVSVEIHLYVVFTTALSAAYTMFFMVLFQSVVAWLCYWVVYKLTVTEV